MKPLQKAFLLRNALVPYIYTQAYEAYLTGVLPAHPVYYDWPEEEEAYKISKLRGPGFPLQHSFGPDFQVSPITTSSQNESGTLNWSIWVPPGRWVDWWTGMIHTGPMMVARDYSAEEIPLLVRLYLIIPIL